MRLPRFRVRTLIVAVALAGVALGIIARRARLLAIAEDHAYRSGLVRHGIVNKGLYDYRGRPTTVLKGLWHGQMAEKYRRAARYPFLPVAPDPHEPEYGETFAGIEALLKLNRKWEHAARYPWLPFATDPPPPK